MKTLLALVCGCVFILCAGYAGPETPPARWRVECQMVIVPQKDLLPLLPDLEDDAKIEATWPRVQEMISQGSAELITTLSARVDEGTRAQMESIEEFRYPTEYEPPALPEQVPKDRDLAEVLKAWPHVGLTPSSFETRNTGTTLEIEIKGRSAPGLLKVDSVAQHVRFLRFAKYDAGRLANGERLSVEQPIFHSMRNQSSCTMREGRRLLLGVHRVPESPKPALEIFVLRITPASSTP